MADEQLSGRELDAMVAERVMEWTRKSNGMMHGKPQEVFVNERGSTISIHCGCAEDFNPSVSIEAAMQVVEKMRELWEIEITTGPGGGWMIRFSNGEPLATTVASGPDLPDVICRGALNARLRTKNNSQM